MAISTNDPVSNAVLTRAAQQVCHYNNPGYALKVLGDLTPEQTERVENVLKEANNQQPPMMVKDLKKALVLALNPVPGPLSELFAYPELLEKTLSFLAHADKISLRTVCKGGESIVSWPTKVQWHEAAMRDVMPKMAHYLNLVKADPCCETSEFSPAGLGYCCYHCELPGLSLTEARRRLVPQKHKIVLGDCITLKKEDATPISIATALDMIPGMSFDALKEWFGEPLVENLAARGRELATGEPYVKFCIPLTAYSSREETWCSQMKMGVCPFFFPISLLGLTFNGTGQLSIKPAIGQSYCFPVHGQLFEFKIEARTVTENGRRTISRGSVWTVTTSYIPAIDSKERVNQMIIKKQ
jgi:hypothetical protein